MKAIEQPTSVVDEVIAEVHRHKRAIMAEHGDDVESLLSDLQERQKGNARLVTRKPATRKDNLGSSQNSTA